MNDEQKIYAFIDSQNLNLAIKDCGWDLDYARFFVYLKDKYKVKKLFSLSAMLQEMKHYILFCKKQVTSLFSNQLLNTKQMARNLQKGMLMQSLFYIP